MIQHQPDQPIGLKRGTVMLSPYNPAWPDLFEAERQRLTEAPGNTFICIEHIGSTAVPCMAAKPLIDMLASVADVSVYKDCLEILQALGYEYMPERITDKRAFFPKGPRDNRTYHLSIVKRDSVDWLMPIAFRDHLRTHPDTAAAYQRLKEYLAKRYQNDRYQYTEAKKRFIMHALQDSIR
jgi:GrpB-like predicted nucleotidyltransferase (UPF0157 family)